MKRIRNRIAEALDDESPVENLLLNETIMKILKEKHNAWRRILSLAVMTGVTAPTGMAALAYFDGMRTERLPGALVQCLRDCLREEGFERVDKEKGELFSCRWNK